MSKLPPSIWVVIPAYNEGVYLETVLQKTKAFTSNIVVVDDGSSDATVALAQKHTPYVLVHQVNLGKGAALKTGCEFVFTQLKGAAIITMDADDQHDPSELPVLAAALEEAPMVFGVRGFDGMPKARAIGNQALSWLVAGLFGKYIPDILSGYKAFSKETYQTIEWSTNAYGVELEIAAKVAKHKLPFTTVTIKTIYHDLDRGMTLLDAFNILIQLLSWRFAL